MYDPNTAQLMRQILREVGKHIVAGSIPDVDIPVRSTVDGSAEKAKLSLLIVEALRR